MVSVRRVAPVLLLIFAIPALAATPKSSSRPPHDLHRVGDHWTAYNPPDPSTYAPNAKTYTIKAGDTLWGLAQEFYKNAYLWPQLWEANTWITDAHWIYPGDVLLVEGEVQSTEGEPAPTSSMLNAGAITPQAAETAPPLTAAETTGPPPIPLAVDADLYCYGYIGDPAEPMPNSIASFEDFEMRYHLNVKEQSDHGSAGDLVYIAGGTASGLVAGDTYMLVEPEELVVHPQSKAPLGRHYAYIGQVKVLCAEETRARGIVSQSCREIPNGARLKPMPQIPIPIARIPDLPAFCDPRTGAKNGFIISSKGWEHGLSVGDLVQVDLGRDEQVQPGDFFTVYRMSPIAGQGRQVLGEIAILTTEAHTATARVVAMRHIMAVGDMVETPSPPLHIE